MVGEGDQIDVICRRDVEKVARRLPHDGRRGAGIRP
jgi:hypothetical protein